MSLWLNLVKHLADGAIGIDDKRGARDTHIGSPHKGLFPVYAVARGDRKVRIRKQRDRELVIAAEFRLRFSITTRDAEDQGALAL